MEATYSPEDNKLRLYAGGRLDGETFKRVKAAGFRWAPKQELFVAPAWTPAREDLLLELCGDVGDEDTSLVERAEERADRFEGYSANRAQDAERAHAAVSAIADGIPMGQPILVGHHSEKRARKDAERIENGMRKAIKAWKTSEYWTGRAAGAIAAAKYKLRPEVRARRIKKLEADRRRLVAEYTPHEPRQEIMQEPHRIPHCAVCGRSRYADGDCEGHEYEWDHTRPEPTLHVWAGSRGAGRWVEVSALPAIEKANARAIEHLDRRLLYERAMLEAEGKSHLLEKPKRPKAPPLLNYRIGEGETLESENGWHPGEIIRYPQVCMSKAEWKEAGRWSDCTGTRLSADKTHRFRITLARRVPGYKPPEGDGTQRWNHAHSQVAVFLTDSKEHPRPEAGELKPARRRELPVHTPPAAKERTKFDELEESLEKGNGVQVVSAPSLFETPPAIVSQVIEAAELEVGHRVLEPSAGTGKLARAASGECGTAIHCIEINPQLAEGLRSQGYGEVRCADFLECVDETGFDRVVMNPPFEKGQDADHVRHAYGMLKPGGRLVAVMSWGPFFRMDRRAQDFRAWFDEVGGEVESLPDDAFKSSGTGVRTRLVVIDR